MVIFFGALIISRLTINSDWQSCSKLVRWCCEWQCQLKYTLLIMMRLCEYSSLLCILFAEGVTSWKAEWLWNHCCCVQQMWVGHSSISSLSKFSEHLRFTEELHQPNKTNARNSPRVPQNCPSHSFPGVFWRNRRYLATKHLQWNLWWQIKIFQGSKFLTNKFRNTYLPFIF